MTIPLPILNFAQGGDSHWFMSKEVGSARRYFGNALDDVCRKFLASPTAAHIEKWREIRIVLASRWWQRPRRLGPIARWVARGCFATIALAVLCYQLGGETDCTAMLVRVAISPGASRGNRQCSSSIVVPPTLSGRMASGSTTSLVLATLHMNTAAPVSASTHWYK